MAFGWAGASAGAADSLEQILTKKLIEAQQAQQLQMQQQRMQQDASQFDANLDLQHAQLARLRAGDAADEAERGRLAARQTQQDDIAAADRRQVGNQQGVRRMIGDFLVQRGSQPLDAGSRQTLQGMAIQEDVDLPEAVTEDPQADVDRARAIAEAQYGAAAKFRAPSTASRQQDWVIRNGTPTPIPSGTAQPGDKPYDPVAARSAQPVNPTEAVDTAREVSRIAGSLRNHKGFASTFGKWDSMKPQWASGQDTIDARTLLNSLKGLLTIENMGKMKGVLSDADMRILQQASTTLASEMSEDAAAAELDRLVDVMGRVTGETLAPAQTGPRGGGRAAGAGPAGGFRILSVE